MTYKYFPATLSACILVATGVHAQRNLEVGIAMGADHFSGDLGNYDGAVQWNGIRPGMKVTFRDYLNNPKRYITRALTTQTTRRSARRSCASAGCDTALNT